MTRTAMIVRPQLQGAIVVQASSPADPDNAKGVQARRPHHKTAATLPCLPPVTEALAMIFGASNQAKDGPVQQECSVHVARASRPREQSWCEGKMPSLRAGELVLRSELLRRVATPATRSQHSRAFTLAELMIAIGIMGIGLVMVMALFPAALKENASSVHDVMGSLICKNAIAIGKSQLQDTQGAYPVRNIQNIATGLQDVPPAFFGYADMYPFESGYVKNSSGATFKAGTAPTPNNTLKSWQDDAWKGFYVDIGANQYKIAGNVGAQVTIDTSPAPSDETPFRIIGARGYLLLARQYGSNNDYQLMAIAYQKEEVLDNVAAFQATNGKVAKGTIEFELMDIDPGLIQIGTPVIDPLTGDYATVVAKSGDKAMLDHEISFANDVSNPLIVCEYRGPAVPSGTAPNPADVVGVRSPVISVLTTRTSLRP